jgi:hypothetical protein
VSNILEDHAAAFLALISGTGLTTYDSLVGKNAPKEYVLVYSLFETPDGVLAPDALSLTLASTALDVSMYVHNVGVTPQSARATASRTRSAVLDQVLTVAGRICFPVRWREGQPARRNEEIPGAPVFDEVAVYGWRSLPA